MDVRRPRNRRSALLIVNLQKDFCSPTGSVYVKDSEKIISVVNGLRKQMHWDVVAIAKDWHPAGHTSFQSAHRTSTSDAKSYKLSNGTKQKLWPDHCIQNTEGSDLHPSLVVEDSDHVVFKGTELDSDSFSAFCELDGKSGTDLINLLRSSDVSDVYVVGVAFELGVGCTALDAAAAGFQTFVVEDATRPFVVDAAEQMNHALQKAGVHSVHSSTVVEVREDRKADVTEYFMQHNIPTMFEYLCTMLVYHKPEDPKLFLIEQLQSMRENKSNQLFNDNDINTVFKMLDPLRKGTLIGEQVEMALTNFGVGRGKVKVDKDAQYDLQGFKHLCKQGLGLSE